MAETPNNVRTVLGVLSAILGMVFLAISSFSEKQFAGNQSLQCIVFIIFTGLFVAFIFVGRSIPSFFEMVCPHNSHFSVKALIHCVFFVIISVLSFLIKYPRFNIHSALTASCIHEAEREEISNRNQFNLFSVGAFSFLALLLSSEREKPTELGFSGLLLGLTIDTSMEIPGRNGPDLWYMFGTALYCILLIFLRHYTSERQRGIFRNFLKLFSAAFGIVFLSLCPFSKDQFGDDAADLEVSFFIVVALLVGNFMSRAPGFISYMANQCHNKPLVKAMVSSLLLMNFSVFIFLTKYPRFQIHSRHKKSCTDDQKIGETLPHGSQFDLYSAAAFSFVAMIISSGKGQSAELGVFNFLLELTMDASIEMFENKDLNLWYVLGAAVYCVVLIFARVYLALAETRDNRNAGEQEDAEMTPV